MIKFDQPLIEGTLIKRYKRFLADITLPGGTVVTAHCPNTGSMKTCGSPGDTVLLSESSNPDRKLKYTWEFTRTTQGYVGINTSRPNQLIAEALRQGAIKGFNLESYKTVRTEVKYGKNSRIDVLLSNDHGHHCYIEIKNTTLLKGESVAFPDAVTERGLKHLLELTNVVHQGHRAIILFLVNRPEGAVFRPAWEIDPDYAKALVDASESGVEAIAIRSVNSPGGMSIGASLPIDLKVPEV